MRHRKFALMLVLVLVLAFIFAYISSTRYAATLPPISILQPSSTMPQRSTLPPSTTLPFAEKCKKLVNWAIVNQLSDNSCETVVRVPDNWCLLILGSVEEISTQNDCTLYLSVSTMKFLPFTLVLFTRWNSSRDLTNLGYLYAIKRGALVIFEMDKTSFSGFSKTPFPSTFSELGDYDKATLGQDHPPTSGWPSGNVRWKTTWSSYQYFGVKDMVPRGYPSSDSIHKSKGVKSLKLHCYPIVKQFLLSNYIDSNHATDVKYVAAFKGNRHVVVPQGILSPYNDRSTMYFREAFWSLLLPKTVHHNLSDIWRSYIAQSLFYTIPDSCLMFSSSNEHSVSCSIRNQPTDSNLAYLQKLTDTLFYLPLQFESIPAGFLETYLHLSKLHFIETEDVHYVQAWNRDLTDIGYKPPNLPNKSTIWTKNIVLCVMFNDPPSVQVLHTLLAYYMRFFTHISMFVDGEWPRAEIEFIPKTVQFSDCPSTDFEADESRKKRGGGFNHRCLAKCLDRELNEDEMQGFLYIPDDVLINLTAAERMPREKVWMPIQHKYQNKSQAYHAPWVIWRKSCGYDALLKVYEELPKEWKGDLKKHDLFPAVSRGSVNVLFIPTSKASKVARVLSFVMNTTDLFVEIAIPLAVNIAVPPKQLFNLPFKEANLIDRRTDVQFMLKTVEKYSYVHPVKISQWQLRELWTTVMSDSLKYYISGTT